MIGWFLTPMKRAATIHRVVCQHASDPEKPSTTGVSKGFEKQVS
jgi:hypothetical protein